MKITKQKSISSLAIAALVLTGGAYYTITQYTPHSIVHAYTSGDNQDPKSAQDNYIITIPDANLKEALNKLIGSSRQANQDITFGDIKAANINRIDLNSENGAKDVTNLEGLQFFEFPGSQLKEIDVKGQKITSIAPLTDLTSLEGLHIQKTQVADLTPVAKLVNLKDLFIDETPITNITPIENLTNLEKLSLYKVKVSDMAALGKITKLTYISISETDISDISLLANNPNLKTVHLGGAKIYDLTPLANLANVTELNINWQRHEVTFAKDNPVLKNPFKNIDGSTVQIADSDNIKNADADGTLNPNGDYIKLVELYGKGSTNTKAIKEGITHASLSGLKLDGDLKINYDLPEKDSVKPTFNPEQPAKIVSRKGKALNLNDVTAQDNQGGSGIAASGVTNNAAAINLDPNNPAKGDYELTYSAQDNAGNLATVKRSIEITDADALQAKVTATTDASLNGYTTDSSKAVTDKKAAAEAIIAQNDATQAQIDQALAELNQAIADLKVNTRKIEAAVGNKYNSAPAHIQNDPAVQAALSKANETLNDPAKTPASVDKAARDLIKAIEDAKQAESDRQTAANDALNEIEGEDKKAARTPNAIQAAKDKINAIKDQGVRDPLLRRLKSVEDAYNDNKTTLQQLITRAQDPATTDGSSQETKDAVAIALQAAKDVEGQANASQADIEQAANNLKEKLDALRPSKAALEATVASVPSESAFVQKDAQVVAKLQAANAVIGDANASADQIKQAKDELEKAIADARAAEADQKAEAQRQTEANTAVEAARDKANRSPVYLNTAQEKIDAVKDPAKKAELQQKLNTLKTEYDQALTALRNLVAQAKDPATTEGMTKETKQLLQQAIAAAEGPATQGDLDQASYETLTKNLQDALAGLLVDKAPLVAAEKLYDDQPDYIKANPTVTAAFRKAQGTRAMAKPTRTQVNNDAKALQDAILAAAQAEIDAQTAATNALTAASDKLNAQLAPNELPAIDFAALEQDVAKIQDPAKRAEREETLKDLRAAYAVRKKQVDDYNAANPATPLPPVANQGNTTAANNATNSKPSGVQAPNTGHQRDTSAGLIAALGGTITAAAGAVIVALRRKK